MKNLAHMRMFAFAMLVAYAVGILTLSRQWITPTYLVLGFATAAQNVEVGNVGIADNNPWRVNNRFIAIALVSSMTFLVVTHFVIRLLVRW